MLRTLFFLTSVYPSIEIILLLYLNDVFNLRIRVWFLIWVLKTFKLIFWKKLTISDHCPVQFKIRSNLFNYIILYYTIYFILFCLKDLSPQLIYTLFYLIFSFSNNLFDIIASSYSLDLFPLIILFLFSIYISLHNIYNKHVGSHNVLKNSIIYISIILIICLGSCTIFNTFLLSISFPLNWSLSL